MDQEREPLYLVHWIASCLRTNHITLATVANVKRTAAREVWACTVTQGTDVQAVVLTIFLPDATATVNASLPPAATARKCALAMQEVAQLGLLTPHFLGLAIQNQLAAVVAKKLERATWHPATRVVAARYLARLHVANMQRLSPMLRHLVQQSDPKQRRSYNGLVERTRILDRQHPAWRSSYPDVADEVQDLMYAGPPKSKWRALVHGDYFSANIIPTPDGLHIIDWETFAVGDPMWDLAFLIGADRNLSRAEVDAVVHAYETTAPIDMPSLLWHKRCWDVGWKLKDVIKRLQIETRPRNS